MDQRWFDLAAGADYPTYNLTTPNCKYARPNHKEIPECDTGPYRG